MPPSSDDNDFYNREYNAHLLADGFDKDRIYGERSRAALAGLRCIPDLIYDEKSGSRLDLYPSKKGSPLFIWIHGGYWRSSSKSENVFVVPGLVGAGVSVASIDYELAPAVSIGEIVRQARHAVAWLYKECPSFGIDVSRIHLGGHSAGGHLVGMLLADGWRGQFGLPESDLFGAALCISGLFDLEPVRRTFVDEQLQLDDSSIATYSPVRHVPTGSEARLLVSVGGKESSEFARQSSEYLQAWKAAGNVGRSIEMPGRHHFDIILELEQAGNPLFDGLVEEIQKFHQ